MQEIQSDGDQRTETTTSEAIERFSLEATNILTWCRQDWKEPVGTFDGVHVVKKGPINGLSWSQIYIPEFRMSHRAALLMLQGGRLTDILVPNHYILAHSPAGGVQNMGPIAHMAVNVGGWRPFSPVIDNLFMAELGEVPEELDANEVLGILVQEALQSVAS